MTNPRWLVLCCLMVVMGPALAQSGTFQSTESQARLLELFTSEGCSSCPPADRWLSSLKTDVRLWQGIVPVAFHVDYWDYIGWKDRFAAPAHAERQRRYARAGHLRNVYTPGFVLNGAEWRGWFVDRRIPEAEPRRVGLLRVEVKQGQGHVTFRPSTRPSGSALVAHVTLLGFDLTTEVGAGENRGRALRHDFAVLGYDAVKLAKQGEAYAAEVRVPATDIQAQRLALALWITEGGNLEPVQAVGGWLVNE